MTATAVEPGVNVFEDNFVLNDLAQTYLDACEEIKAFKSRQDEALKAAKEARNTPSQLLKQAETMARPTDGSQPDQEVLSALREYEKARDLTNKLRRAAAEKTAEVLGVTMDVERPEPDKDERKTVQDTRRAAQDIAKSMRDITERLRNEEARNLIASFLEVNELPSLTGDSTWNAMADSSTATKHRVAVRAISDGTEKFNVNGISKAVLEARKLYSDKSQAPGDPVFRNAWEGAGNKAGEIKQPNVTVEHNGVTYEISYRTKS